jgi:carboxyl-terminal processing protease
MTSHKLETDHIPELDTRVKKPHVVPLWLCAVLVIFGVMVGIYISNQSSSIQFGNQQRLNLASVQKTYSVLQEKYDGKLNSAQLIEGASKGLVEAAGDPYTIYMDKKEAEEFNKDLDGTFSGIGAELDKKDGQLIVISPLEGSPAKEAGIQSKDVILRVNNQDTTKWSIDQAVRNIKGKEGTTVKLTLLRDGTVIEKTITRSVITVPSVTSEQRDGVGIITISRFGEDTASLTRKEAIQLKEANIQHVILDLRGDGGGYLDAAIEVASLWLQQDSTIVVEKRDGKIIDKHTAIGDPILKGIPTVVMIDGGSASASEIVAGALDDNKAATLVGEKSFGKGSVQTTEKLSNGGVLKVTIARWYTPNGKNINKEGIRPDIEVTRPATDTNDNDTQLIKAFEVVKSR